MSFLFSGKVLISSVLLPCTISTCTTLKSEIFHKKSKLNKNPPPTIKNLYKQFFNKFNNVSKIKKLTEILVDETSSQNNFNSKIESLKQKVREINTNIKNTEDEIYKSGIQKNIDNWELSIMLNVKNEVLKNIKNVSDQISHVTNKKIDNNEKLKFYLQKKNFVQELNNNLYSYFEKRTFVLEDQQEQVHFFPAQITELNKIIFQQKKKNSKLSSDIKKLIHEVANKSANKQTQKQNQTATKPRVIQTTCNSNNVATQYPSDIDKMLKAYLEAKSRTTLLNTMISESPNSSSITTWKSEFCLKQQAMQVITSQNPEIQEILNNYPSPAQQKKVAEIIQLNINLSKSKDYLGYLQATKALTRQFHANIKKIKNIDKNIKIQKNILSQKDKKLKNFSQTIQNYHEIWTNSSNKIQNLKQNLTNNYEQAKKNKNKIENFKNNKNNYLKKLNDINSWIKFTQKINHELSY